MLHQYLCTEANQRRAGRILNILGSYQIELGEDGRWDDEETLIDLLVDARHYAAQQGFYLDEIDRLVRLHFEAEARGEDEDDESERQSKH